MATPYLILYNAAQTLGWSYIAVAGARAYSESPSKLYSAVEMPLQLFQTMAALEILHAMLGLVRSNVFVTAFQVASRVFLVWPILAAFVETQSSVGFPMLLTAWTVTEIIRYGLDRMGNSMFHGRISPRGNLLTIISANNAVTFLISILSR